MKNPGGILVNKKTGRFHPILFRLAPLPSSTGEESVQRYKSIGHHTEGFETLEGAQAQFLSGEPLENYANCGIVWDWDGDSIPAMVEFFSNGSSF